MNIEKPSQIFSLKIGDKITKRNLFDLIQYSKVENSKFWEDNDHIIRNTPQQGINWVGDSPNVKGVIIKTHSGAYKEDGWEDENKSSFRYSFKFRNNKVNFSDSANIVLIQQPKYNYPILLFIEDGKDWEYEGRFFITQVRESSVSLEKYEYQNIQAETSLDEILFQEGSKKYSTHLVIERNRKVVKAIKDGSEWVCDICEENFYHKYEVEYIEAHHKIPISQINNEGLVKLSDFALLCPNCHKAVHIHMKLIDGDYETIKKNLKKLLNKPDAEIYKRSS